MTNEIETTHFHLEERLYELDHQLTLLTRQQHQSFEEIMSLKHSVGQLSSQCNDLNASISRAQSLSQFSSSTFLTFTSDVQTESDELSARIPRLILPTFQSQRPCQSARVERPAHVDPHIEIKQLKAGVKLLEKEVIQEKERFVSAKAQIKEGRNGNQSNRIQKEMESASQKYRSLKKKQREMESEIERLKDLQCNPELPICMNMTENLRMGLLSSHSKSCVC
jgi:predicted  nucleic acid-binding Zn-ribbon protein